jgi:hypothetical protein
MNKIIRKETMGVSNPRRSNKSAPALHAMPGVITSLFADLSGWTGERGLVKLTLDAVQSVEAPRRAGATAPAHQPRMMVTLLAYCYAKGLYGSRQIEEAIQSDPVIRYLCAREYPDWKDLRRFRREHRDWIGACLSQVLKQAWAWKLDEAEVDFQGYAWFETELNPVINDEVRLRLEVAAFVDLMEDEA